VEVRWFEEWAVNSFSGFYLRWYLLPRLRTLIDGPLAGRGLVLGPGTGREASYTDRRITTDDSRSPIHCPASASRGGCGSGHVRAACNKILMLLFGGEALLTYYEPVRIYVAVAGASVLAAAVVHQMWRRLAVVGPARTD